MRAGKLTKTLTIERATTTVDAYGTPAESWATIAVVRGQLIQSSTEEFMRNFGASSEIAAVFCIRYRDGIKVADRITCDGITYDLKEVKELGRREWLDLRVVAVGAD